MGGYGSGRTSSKPTAEACGSIVLDLDALLRACRGRSNAQLELNGKAGSPYTLGFWVTLGDDGWGTLRIAHLAFDHWSSTVPQASYDIALEAAPCGFGGRRWVMVCPRSGSRVRKLFLPNGAARFASRAAYRLGYRSQQVTPLDKSHARLRRLYAKLGADCRSIDLAIPDKPHRMRWATYDRLVDKIEAAQERHAADYVGRWSPQLRHFASTTRAGARPGPDAG